MRRILLALLALVFAASFAAPAAATPFHARHARTITTSDPLGVTLNGLNAVYHLKDTNGARGATTNVAAYAFPTGASYSAGTQNTSITASAALSGINNAGHGGFYFSGDQTSTLTDATITCNSGVTLSGNPLTTGSNGAVISGVSNVDVEHFTVDGAGCMFQGGMIFPHGTGAFQMGFGIIMNAPRDPLVTDGANAVYTLHDNYWGSYANNTDTGDHNEENHFQSCAPVTTVTRSNYNEADGLHSIFNNAAAFQVQTGIGSDPSTYTGGPCRLDLTFNVINYGAVVNQGTFSLKAVFDDITVNAGTNTMSKAATAPWTIIVKQADLVVSGVSGTFVSGETLTATGGKSAPLLGPLSGGNNLHLSNWGSGAHFVNGDVLTGGTSGATATVVTPKYHDVIFNDLGSNRDFAGNLVSLP